MPGEDRRPTLSWPRNIPIEGEPADVVGSGVVANAVHPGLVKNTSLLLDVGGPFRWITNAFGAPAEKAVDTALWLATSRETAAVSGKLWAKRKELPTPGMGSDPDARKRQWDACSHLAGLPGICPRTRRPACRATSTGCSVS